MIKQIPINATERVKDTVVYLLGEVYNNAVEHSESKYVIGNCYDDRDNARICFFCYDASIGIIESVRRYLKNILVAKYTNSGFTQYDAEKIVSVLKTELPELKDDDVINFDFSDVKFYYNAFFKFFSLCEEKAKT